LLNAHRWRLSYALMGLSLVCLLAVGAELFYYGFTKEAISHISIVVCFGLLLSIKIIEEVSMCIQMIREFDERYEQFQKDLHGFEERKTG